MTSLLLITLLIALLITLLGCASYTTTRRTFEVQDAQG